MLHSDVEIELNEGSEEIYTALIATLETLGAPKGSLLHIESEDRTIPFGVTEGLAVYLNGADLPKEVYAGNDINDFIEQLEAALGERGRFLSYWEGERETGLYLYGPSSAAMAEALRALLEAHPLSQLHRLKQSP